MNNTNVIQGNPCLGKCHSGSCPVGKCPFRVMPVQETVLRGTVYSGTVCWGNVNGGKFFGKLSHNHRQYLSPVMVGMGILTVFVIFEPHMLNRCHTYQKF